MKPLSRSGFPLGIAAALLSVGSGYSRTIAGSFTKLTPANAKLWLTAGSRKAPSGCPLVLTAHIRNLGNAPVYIPAGLGPLQFFSARAKLISSHRPVPWLRAGILGREMNINRLIAVLVPPGKSVRFWRRVEINRHYDMSMPGQYAIRFAVGHLESNWLKFLIRPPEVQLPVGKILRPSLRGWPHHREKTRNAVNVRLFELAGAGKTQPEGVWVYLRGGKRSGKNVELTGNRLLDLRAMQVEGPDGYNGDELVKIPKPHYIPIPNHQQVPLTAYGKWLLKHPPKKMPTKRYTLKSGVVYRYAVPINLSCEYDMSLAGVYHVRVELAHPKIWSNWINITVP